ncbi:MAG: class I SAM-dependent methyltransferase [Actinobacteria bacterium]|nr:class I SAM-dependent methyltransferase [Actinomycetota bacterium]
MDEKDRIREFWDGRAEQFGASMRATLGEVHLRELEIRTMRSILARRKLSTVLEIGCGNGYSTFIYAKEFPDMKIYATDFSQPLIDIAAEHYANDNIAYALWDITDEGAFPFDIAKFDLIFSQRVIQNLPTWDEQKKVIGSLQGRLEDGGSLVLMECSEEGVEQLNRWRKILRKEPIEGIIPWHNKFIMDSVLKEEFGGDLVKVKYFSSSYMLATRLITERLAKFAWRFPSVGWFGYDRIYVFRKPDE